MSLLSALTAVEALREMDSDATARVISTFLLIATNPDIELREIQSKLGLGQTAASRCVMHLSKWKTSRVQGMGLVEAYDDEQDRRLKRVRLTAAGERLKARML